MKKIAYAIAIALLSACATTSPEEITQGKSAIKPTQADAERAVAAFFSMRLKNPESARYSYQELVNSRFIFQDTREFGWFVCGTIDAKNSADSYAGSSPFFAYFDPADPVRVLDGAMDDSPGLGSVLLIADPRTGNEKDEASSRPSVADWCNGIYGRKLWTYKRFGS